MKDLIDKINRLMIENEALNKENSELVENIIKLENQLKQFELQVRDKSNSIDKDKQEEYLIEIMHDDEKDGLYGKSNSEGGAMELYKKMFQKPEDDPNILLREVYVVDAIKFAEAYSTSQMKKKVEEIEPFIKLAKQLIINKQSIFKNLELSKEDKVKILIQLNYSPDSFF